MPAHSPDPVHGGIPRRVVDVGDSGDLATEISEIALGRRHRPRLARHARRPTGSPPRRPASASASPSGSPPDGSPSSPSRRARWRPDRSRDRATRTRRWPDPALAPERVALVRHRRPRPRHLRRVIWGARVSLVVGFASIVLRPAHRRHHRALAGYYQGRSRPSSWASWTSCWPSRPCCWPWPSSPSATTAAVPTIVLALGVVSIPPVARLVRANTLVYSQREFVLAARTLGASDGRIIVARGPAQRDLPGHVVLADRRRRRHRRRGRPRLPRAVGRAAHPDVGRHDHRRPGLIADARWISVHPLHGAVPHRAGPQPRSATGSGQSSTSRRVRCEPQGPSPPSPGSPGRPASHAARGRRPHDPLPHRPRHRPRRRRRVVHARAGQDARRRRRVRLGQDGARPARSWACSPRRNVDRERPASASTGTEIIGATTQKQMRDVWGTEMSMVFQDPMTSLNPVMKIGKQITESLRHHLDIDRKDGRGHGRSRCCASVRHPRPPSSGSTSTRTSCRAACASAS